MAPEPFGGLTSRHRLVRAVQNRHEFGDDLIARSMDADQIDEPRPFLRVPGRGKESLPGLEALRVLRRPQPVGGGGGGGGGLSAVEGGELAQGRVPVYGEGAAADSRMLRLDKPEHHLYRDGGVGGGPPGG